MVVPRSGVAVKAGAGLVASEEAWLYPLLLALDMGSEPPAELRQIWFAASRKN